jgi:hypothetical protein
MSPNKKVTIEFEVSEKGVETSSVLIFFNDEQVGFLTDLELSLDIKEALGSFSFTVARNLPKEVMQKLMELYNAKTPE